MQRARGGLPAGGPLAAARAARLIGIALVNSSAAAWLALSRWRKSPARPSLRSIIEWIAKFSTSQRASASRGSKSRCLPAREPPNSPVTKMASPGRAPERSGALPRRDPANQRNRDQPGGRIGGGLASYDRDLVTGRELTHSRIHRFHSRGFEFRGQSQRDQRGCGRSGHGCDVAQATCQRLPSDLFRRISLRKCTPSTTASVLNRSHRLGVPKSSAAQSSPGPTTTEWLDGQGLCQALDQLEFVHSGRIKPQTSRSGRE